MPPDEDRQCPREYVEWVRNSMESAFEFAGENLQKSFERQKKYDQKSKHQEYSVGSLVWRWYPPKAHQKLGLAWTGPYRIVAIAGDTSVQIQSQLNEDVSPIWVHMDDLKPYRGYN